MRKKVLLSGFVLILLIFISACSNDAANDTASDNAENSNNATNEGNDTGIGGLVLKGDTVSEQAGCVLDSRFNVGEKIVFRMDAIDPTTDEQVVDAKLQVHLSTGEVLDMVYAEHPPGGEASFWTAAYVVTEDTPTGILNYTVKAEAGDKTAEFEPFNVQPSLLTIVGEEGEAAAPEEDAETDQEATPATAEVNQDIEMVATNFKFDQEEYHVNAGEEVTITLTSDEGTHGINIDEFDVSIEAPGGTATFTPTEPGEYKIYCNIFCGEGHGEMTAILVVM